jgi:tRNA dimethylallyltransferase
MASLQGKRAPADASASIRIALMPRDRARLHHDIATRFDAMLAAGLVDELASLRQRHALDRSMPSMRCVGYRQAWAFLEGEVDRGGLRESGIAATRQLARRQLTWLRATAAEPFDPWEPDLPARVLALLKRSSPVR